MTSEIVDNLLVKISQYIKKNMPQLALQTSEDIIKLEQGAIGWYSLALSKYNAEQYDEGLAAIAKAAEIDPKKKEIWILGGYLLIATRQYNEAKQAFDYALEIDENDFEANFGLFICYIIQKDEQMAKKIYEKLKELDQPSLAKMLYYFYENFYSGSNTINQDVKEDLEILIKKFLVEK
ncbi:MAG: tetratricopeptide repeat protein [Candidatus Anstonellaceae archaeon]